MIDKVHRPMPSSDLCRLFHDAGCEICDRLDRELFYLCAQAESLRKAPEVVMLLRVATRFTQMTGEAMYPWIGSPPKELA